MIKYKQRIQPRNNHQSAWTETNWNETGDFCLWDRVTSRRTVLRFIFKRRESKVTSQRKQLNLNNIKHEFLLLFCWSAKLCCTRAFSRPRYLTYFVVRAYFTYVYTHIKYNTEREVQYNFKPAITIHCCKWEST